MSKVSLQLLALEHAWGCQASFYQLARRYSRHAPAQIKKILQENCAETQDSEPNNICALSMHAVRQCQWQWQCAAVFSSHVTVEPQASILLFNVWVCRLGELILKLPVTLVNCT